LPFDLVLDHLLQAAALGCEESDKKLESGLLDVTVTLDSDLCGDETKAAVPHNQVDHVFKRLLVLARQWGEQDVESEARI